MTRRHFGKADRRAAAAAADGAPTLGIWIARIEAIDNDDLTAAVEGIWCGRDGETRLDMEGTTSLLCVGWHDKRVEWSYIS
jgi:hypothetical protein